MYSKEWLEVLSSVDKFVEQCHFKEAWFRGHKKSSYKLLAGLFREDHKGDIRKHLENEINYYYEFENSGWSHHKTSDWSLLYIMQHFGVRTRLLDWTRSFSVALFFATKNWDGEQNARIWMLDPCELNYLSQNQVKLLKAEFEYKQIISGMVEPNNSVAIYPEHNNPRIIAQQGVFIVQGNTLSPLNEEEFYGRQLRRNTLDYVDITPNMKDDAKKFLRISGINHFALFPDLSGLAQKINDQYPVRLKE